MADEGLQRLRRAARAGDAEAEARLLLARVRAGQLAPERLGLAAHLGAPAARALVGEERGGTWALGLWAFGAEAVVRAGIAAARARLAAEPDGARTALAVELLEAWLLEAEPARRAALRARAEALGAGDEGLLLRWTLRLFAEHDRGGPRQVEGCWLPGPVWELMEAAEDAIGAKLTKSATARHRRRLAAAAVRRALQEELLPWCLGEGDPLRARLAARGGP